MKTEDKQWKKTTIKEFLNLTNEEEKIIEERLKMEEQLKQLETKINLILEYIVQKEKTQNLKYRCKYEYMQYEESKSDDSQAPTHLEIHDQNYRNSSHNVEKCTLNIEENLRLDTLNELTKQAQELDMGY